jgi:5'-nucleotidase
LAEILLTNDDGIHSSGILALAESLSRLGRVTIVAPDREVSASSQSLTLNRPIRYEELAPGRYAVDGTPTDCVILGVHYLLPVRPDLVISGINRGPNLGRDISYSGTVAGAVEAANHDIPAFAISLAARKDFRFEQSAQFAAMLAEKMLAESLSADTVLNVNVPETAIRGVRITVQGRRNIRDLVVENCDPRGRKYFWFDQDLTQPNKDEHPAADFVAVQEGYISITPLRLDRTSYDAAESISHWPETLFKAVSV